MIGFMFALFLILMIRLVLGFVNSFVKLLLVLFLLFLAHSCK